MALSRLQVIRGHLSSSPLNVTPASSITLNYSLPSGPLTTEQRLFYEDNGYLVVPNLIEDNLLDDFSKRFVDLCEGRVPKGAMTLMKDVVSRERGLQGEYLYNKAQDILRDEVFERYILHEKLIDYVASFVGPNVTAVHSMLINKPPDAGKLTSRHPLHQDLYYFPFRPAERIVAAWTALERITGDNGCLFVLPGTHKGTLLQHDYPQWQGGVNKAYHGVHGYEDVPTVQLPMNKGDTVFFHPLLIHGSGPNLTKGFRKAISCHYASSDCHFIDVEGTVQESIAREIEEMALRRGFSVTMEEAWKFRSLLVRGRAGTF